MSERDLGATKAAHERESRITVGELRERLAVFDDADEVTFGSTVDADPLLFCRVKNRGATEGRALVHLELYTLTDDAMRDELAWAWVRRVSELRDAILFVAGEEGTARPTEAETAALKALVAELKADPALLDAADGFVWSTDSATNARATRALHAVARWAGLGG